MPCAAAGQSAARRGLLGHWLLHRFGSRPSKPRHPRSIGREPVRAHRVECERDLSTQPPRTTLAKAELGHQQIRIDDRLATEVADELFADDYSQGVLPVSVSTASGFYDPGRPRCLGGSQLAIPERIRLWAVPWPGKRVPRSGTMGAMTFEELLRQDFRDDTAYERLVLETIIDPNKAPPGAVFATDDIRGSGRKSFRGVHDSVGSGAVEILAARFRPLAFGAAYKILDFMVEMTMRLNGEPCPAGRWTFTQKTAFIGRGRRARLPSPLDSTPAFWLRATRLYTAFDEHRHAVVHRRTRIEANGDFTGSDRVGHPLAPVSVVEQDALSRLAAALAVALIEADTSQRQLNRIGWSLDALCRHHGCGLLGATPPPAAIVRVIDDMQPVGPGRWQVDGVKLHAHLRELNLQPIDADVELHAVDSHQEILYQARLDEVPDAVVELDLAALPAWLRRI